MLLSHAGAETAAPTTYDWVGLPRTSCRTHGYCPNITTLNELSSLPRSYCANDPSMLEDIEPRAETVRHPSTWARRDLKCYPWLGVLRSIPKFEQFQV